MEVRPITAAVRRAAQAGGNGSASSSAGFTQGASPAPPLGTPAMPTEMDGPQPRWARRLSHPPNNFPPHSVGETPADALPRPPCEKSPRRLREGPDSRASAKEGFLT